MGLRKALIEPQDAYVRLIDRWSGVRGERNALVVQPTDQSHLSAIWQARKLMENTMADEFTFLGVAEGIGLVLL